MTSPDQPLVAPGFAVPQPPATDCFRLEPLGPQHNAADHAAWTSSITHIRATPGFAGRSWPPSDGMTPEANLHDLREHAKDFDRRVGFTYTVLSVPGDEVIGCVYIYGSRHEPRVTEVRSWVSATAHIHELGRQSAPAANRNVHGSDSTGGKGLGRLQGAQAVGVLILVGFGG